MRSTHTHIAIVILLVSLAASPAQAQTRSVYTLAMRGVPLNEALAEFSHLTGAGISFDPALIETENAQCVIEEAEEEDVLACILSRSGLDHIRLSSGTFVIVESREQEAIHGSLAGIVRDIETGQPLPHAHVLLASASMELGVVTNGNGQFALPPLLPGAYLVNTSYLGYHDHLDTLVVQAGSNAFRRIDMREEPIVFAPLIIDGLQRRRPAEALDKSVLFRRDVLEAGNYLQRDGVIQQTAAIPGVRINDLTADAHLQGSDTGEHQFRLDGIPIFLPQSAVGLIGPFSPFAIESIEVHQAGFGVEEGSHLAGVFSARHRLEDNRTIDIQIDPMSINGRAAGMRQLANGQTVRGMLTARTSFWRYFQQPAFQTTLNAWSKPDPFLIFGPVRQYSDVDPAFFQDILNISTVPNTDLAFQDIHAAGEYPINAFSAIRASMYIGKNKFGGTLIPRALTGRVSFGNENDLVRAETDVFPAPLSKTEEYRWNNLAGQINYHTLLGNHTLFNLQLRGSTYDLEQNYQLIDSDSLLVHLDELDTPDFAANPDPSVVPFNIPPADEFQDDNHIDEYAVEARLEHARNRHLLSTGLETAITSSRFDLLLPSLIPISAQVIDTSSIATVDLERIAYSATTARLAGFLQDRIELSRTASAELGVRVTYLPLRKTVYAEPRLSLRFDRSLGTGGSIAFQTAAGLYRQYLLQFDISTLNAGALFPSKRVWLPIDRNTRPPLAYHLSQSVLYNPTQEWTIRASAYLKLYQRSWTINYLDRPSLSARNDVANLSFASRQEFQSQARGNAAGASIHVSRQTGRLHTSASYEYSDIRRRSQDLFSNATTSAPWEEPHRLTVTTQWRPWASFLMSARFTGVWGRSWGFRQAYYDFFGHSEETRYQPPYDFGDPDSHVLPPLYQLDFSAVVSRPIRSGAIQLRLDLLNALDYDNVVDWRLVWKDQQLAREKRLLYPRIPSLALRFSW